MRSAILLAGLVISGSIAPEMEYSPQSVEFIAIALLIFFAMDVAELMRGKQ